MGKKSAPQSSSTSASKSSKLKPPKSQKAVQGNTSILSFFSKVSSLEPPKSSKKRKLTGKSEKEMGNKKRRKSNEGKVVISLSSDSEPEKSSLFSADELAEDDCPSSVKEEPKLFLPESDDEFESGAQGLAEELENEEAVAWDLDEGEGQVTARMEDFEIEEMEDEGILICPICNLSLGKKKPTETQLHVNACLDALSAPIEEAVVTSKQQRSPSPTPAKPERSPSAPPPPSNTKKKLRALPAPHSLSTSDLSSLSTGPNAFHSLMQGHAEDKAWKSAAASEAVRGIRGDKRDVPFYKIMDGMEISVDAFRYGKIEGVKGYFLTHAHSDHYTNLSANWNHGPIYCSVTTANLIKHNLGVKDRWVKALPMNETVTVEGIKVTLLDANHCPGSVLFLFEGPHTNPSSPWSRQPNRIFRYLHCGDFRASPEHLEHEAIKGKKIDIVYLDTTYCNPKYVFPSQPQVIQAVSELISQTVGGDESAIRRGTKDGQNQIKEEALMKGWLSASKDEEEEEVPISKNTRKNILILVGTYSIGKERVVKGIAKAIDSKIYCNDTKAKTFACIDDAELHSMLTKDPLEAQVHVTNLFGISRETLEEYLESFKGHFTSIIGLRPTGWTFKAERISTSVPTVKDVLQRESKRTVPPTFFYPQRGSTDKCQLFGVPYSEHSSFFELSCFIVSANCTRIIPTVNVGSEKSRSEMKKWFERWKAERKRLIEAGEGRKPGLLVKPRAKDYW